MNILFKKFFFLRSVIFLSFILSIIFSNQILKFNDIYISENNITYHKMIKADPYRYLSHGAEIKKEVEEGNNFFLSGRENYTKYLPPRIAALYYITFKKNLFNNFEDREINIGIHNEYIILQCFIYFLSILFLFNSIKNRIDSKVLTIFIFSLCLEPTITQYNFTFWSESIFFSFQIIILGFLFKKNQNLKNLFLIGLFVGILSLQRQIAFFYIIPICLYYFIFYNKNLSKLLIILIGYSSIQLSMGYINFLKTDKFHIMTSDSKIEIHRSFVVPVISKKNNISNTEFNIQEGLIVRDWLEKNKIAYNNKEKFLSKELNYIDWMDYRREIIRLKDKIIFDNYIKSRSFDYIKKNPIKFLRHYIDRSMHVLILNPFHIYSDMNFISGEIYYETKSHQKYIPIRIFYTLLIFIFTIVGFIFLYKKKKFKTLTIISFSIIYFFGLVGWSGNTRYFVPNLIYILLLFSYGSHFIYKTFKKSKKFNLF